MADEGEGRNPLGELGAEAHLGRPGLGERNAVQILHRRHLPRKRAQIRADDLDSIPCRKFIAQTEDCVPRRVAGLDDGADLPLAQIAGILRKLAGLAIVKAG